MIDNFGLAVSHGLILLAAWRVIFRPDLDDEDAEAAPPPADQPRPLPKDRARA